MLLNRSYILLVILFLGLFPTQKTSAQARELKFNILKKDKSIGFLKIHKSESSVFTDYILSTFVEVSFIKKFRVKAIERYRYQGDLLIYSELKRTINEKSKDPKSLKMHSNKYILSDGKKSKIFGEPEIKTNLVRLYFSEPIKIDRVYCDNQQMMLKLEKLGQNRYRIDFPNGVSNIFHYEAGKCIKVDVEGSFFKVRLLKE